LWQAGFACSIGVEDQGDTLEDPMTDMSVGLDVSHEDHSLAHGVLSVLSHVNRRLDCAPELELVSFDGDNANQRHLNNQFLRVLVVEAVVLDAPPSTL